MTAPDDTAFPAELGRDTYGLTKREYFAALVLRELLASPRTEETDTPEDLAGFAVKAADTLIDALNAKE